MTGLLEGGGSCGFQNCTFNYIDVATIVQILEVKIVMLS